MIHSHAIISIPVPISTAKDTRIPNWSGALGARAPNYNPTE